jgi:hypothetical protein
LILDVSRVNSKSSGGMLFKALGQHFSDGFEIRQ